MIAAANNALVVFICLATRRSMTIPDCMDKFRVQSASAEFLRYLTRLSDSTMNIRLKRQPFPRKLIAICKNDRRISPLHQLLAFCRFHWQSIQLVELLLLDGGQFRPDLFSQRRYFRMNLRTHPIPQFSCAFLAFPDQILNFGVLYVREIQFCVHSLEEFISSKPPCTGSA